MIIAVDFDGTLHTGEWPGIGAPAPFAIETMQKLRADGHYLIIWTCREGDPQRDAINWLLENGIPFDRINDHEPAHMLAFGGSNARKVYAHLYVDDKQVGGLPPWPEIYKFVSETEAEYLKRKEAK